MTRATHTDLNLNSYYDSCIGINPQRSIQLKQTCLSLVLEESKMLHLRRFLSFERKREKNLPLKYFFALETAAHRHPPHALAC